MQYEFGYGAFRELGIPVISGPKWKTEDKDLICENLGPYWCDYVTNFDGERQPQPVKSREWLY